MTGWTILIKSCLFKYYNKLRHSLPFFKTSRNFVCDLNIFFFCDVWTSYSKWRPLPVHLSWIWIAHQAFWNINSIEVYKKSTLLGIKLVIKTWHSTVHAPKLCSPGVLTSLTWITHTIEWKMLEQLMNICFDLIFQLDITQWQTIENKLYVALYLVSFKEEILIAVTEVCLNVPRVLTVSWTCHKLTSRVSQYKSWKEKRVEQRRTFSKVMLFPCRVLTKFAIILTSVFINLRVFKASQFSTLIYLLKGSQEKGNPSAIL